MLVTSWEMLAKREGLQEGLQEGRQEGLQEGRASLLLEILAQRFGKLSLRLQHQISRLTIDELRDLGLATYGFSEIKQLRDWLAEHKPTQNTASKAHRSPSAKRKKMMMSLK